METYSLKLNLLSHSLFQFCFPFGRLFLFQDTCLFRACGVWGAWGQGVGAGLVSGGGRRANSAIQSFLLEAGMCRAWISLIDGTLRSQLQTKGWGSKFCVFQLGELALIVGTHPDTTTMFRQLESLPMLSTFNKLKLANKLQKSPGVEDGERPSIVLDRPHFLVQTHSLPSCTLRCAPGGSPTGPA